MKESNLMSAHISCKITERYCRHPVSSNQFVHSPFIALITKTSPPAEMLYTECFFFVIVVVVVVLHSKSANCKTPCE